MNIRQRKHYVETTKCCSGSAVSGGRDVWMTKILYPNHRELRQFTCAGPDFIFDSASANPTQILHVKLHEKNI